MKHVAIYLRVSSNGQDTKSQEFEHKYIAELLAGVDRAVAIFDELDKLIAKVRNDCE